MSKRHYPRYDSRRPLPKGTFKLCEYKDCFQKAVSRVFVQVSYMRGDDEDYCVCEAHRKFPDGPENLDSWVASMRPMEPRV